MSNGDDEKVRIMKRRRDRPCTINSNVTSSSSSTTITDESFTQTAKRWVLLQPKVHHLLGRSSRERRSSTQLLFIIMVKKLMLLIIACILVVGRCHGFTIIHQRHHHYNHQHRHHKKQVLLHTLRVWSKARISSLSLSDSSSPRPSPLSPSVSESLFARSNTSSWSNDALNDSQKMKKKKNKYAKFSKVEQIEKDPFEALIEESERKLKSIQEEKQLDPIRRQEQAIIEQGGKILTQEEQEKLRLQFPNTTEINPYDATSFGYMEIGTIIGPHGVHGWTRVQGETDYPERLTSAGMILHLKPPRRRAPRKVTLASGKQIEPNVFLIQLQGIYNRTAASKLKGAVLYYATQQDTTINKDEGEMLLSDLVGLTVYKRRAPEDSTSDQYDDISCKSNTNGVIVGKVLGFVLGEEMCGIPGLFHDQLEIQLIDDDEDNEDNEGIVPDQGRDPNSGSGGDGANRQGRKRLERKRRPPPKLVMIPMVPEIVTKVDLDGQSIVIDPPAGLLDLTYEREEKVQIKGLLAPASDD